MDYVSVVRFIMVFPFPSLHGYAYRGVGGGGGGRGVLPLPSEVFLSFSWTMFVFPSRALSDGQSKWLRDMTSKVAGGQGIFGSKCMLFQLISTIKVKLVDIMMKSTYLWIIFTCQAQKITNCHGFCLISNSW